MTIAVDLRRKATKQTNKSEDLDECGISSGSALFFKTKLNFRKIHFFLNYVTLDPSIHLTGHTDFIVCSFMENSIGPKRFKRYQ